MKTGNKTRLALVILPTDIDSTSYYDGFACAITKALGRAGKTDIMDIGDGIRTLDFKRFDDYNIRGYKAMRRYVLAQYKNKEKGNSSRNRMKEFIIEFDESVYSNGYQPQPNMLIAKIKQLFGKNK